MPRLLHKSISLLLQRKTFAVSHQGRGGGLTLDWQSGFSLSEGADPTVLWQFKFSQLRGSSDDGKSKLKLHFQDQETRSIETKVSFKQSFFCSGSIFLDTSMLKV